MKIFISYAKSDTRELAFALADALDALEDLSVWVDRSLRAGAAWELQIQQQIDRCDTMIVLYSPDINRHKQGQPESYVLNEIAYARYTAKKPIIPIMAQLTDPPMALTMVQYLDYTLDGLRLDDLVEALCGELGVRMVAGAVVEAPETIVITPSPVMQTQDRTAPPPVRKPAAPDFLPAPFEWIEIPAGPFLMGSDPAKDADAQDEEQPQITVNLPTYAIAKYPVTYAQYQVFVDDGGYENDRYWTAAGLEWRGTKQYPVEYWQDSKWHIPDHPVVGVTWYEARAFSRWLGAKSGMSVRLPMEPEWEKAARGTDGRIYPWGDQIPDKNLCNVSDIVGKTTPVMQYPAGASPYGVMDMAGNVWEWCLTKAAEGKFWNYGDGLGAMDNDPADDDERVVRGGSWYYTRSLARVAYRSRNKPDNCSDLSFGFRVSCGSSPRID